MQVGVVFAYSWECRVTKGWGIAMTNTAELRNDTRSERWDIYKEARNSIKQNNVPEMSLDEINAEISAARAGR